VRDARDPFVAIGEFDKPDNIVASPLISSIVGTIKVGWMGDEPLDWLMALQPVSEYFLRCT